MATKFSKSKASANNANRGLYKKGGSMKYQDGGTAVEPKRKAGDTVYATSVPVTKIIGNKGKAQGAPTPKDTATVRYGDAKKMDKKTYSKRKLGGSIKKK
tara:strand:- start:654 stop:953 length:300 start_codon:yes stop_codon:yes gene_type:complete